MAISQKELERRAKAGKAKAADMKRRASLGLPAKGKSGLTGLTTILSTDPTKIQQQKVAENVAKQGIFMRQSESDKISPKTKTIETAKKDAFAEAVNKSVQKGNEAIRKSANKSIEKKVEPIKAAKSKISWTEQQKQDPSVSYEQWKGGQEALHDAEFASSQAPSTKQEKAQALIDKEREDQIKAEIKAGTRQGEVAIDEFGNEVVIGAKKGEGTALTEEDELALFKKEQEEKKTELEQHIAEINRLADEEFRQEQRRGVASIAGTTAATAQDREGVVSTTAPQIATEFGSRVRQGIEASRSRLEMAKTQRAGIMRDLEKAQRAGNIKQASNLRKNLAAAENAIDQVQLDLVKEQGENMKEAKSFLDLMSTGGLAANMDLSQLQSAFADFGLPIGYASALQASAQEALNADIADREFKEQQTKKLANDIINGNTPTSVKEYNFLQKLDGKARDEFSNLLKTKSGYQFIKDADGNIYSANPNTGKVEKEINVTGDTGNGIYVPTKGKYSFDLTGSGVSWGKSLPVTKVFKPGVRGNQCGELVNDALGVGAMGDTFATKKTNSSVPIAGGAFVEWTGHTAGHAGLVEEVFADGSFSIRDSNYTIPGKVNTAIIKPGGKRYNNIVNKGGFYVPGGIKNVTAGTKDKDKEAIKIAQDIFSGVSTQKLSDVSTKNNLRSEVSTQLTKLKEEALDSGNVIGAMQASAGGSTLDATSRSQFIKTATVIRQLSSLNNTLNKKKLIKDIKDKDGGKIDWSPITGVIKGKNPWSKEGQATNAQLQATIPNLARGVFGEVGVLTDRDVELYRKTLPNLTQPEDIRKSITAITLRTLRNSLDDQIEVNAGSGVDMSGLVPKYKQLNKAIQDIELDLGVMVEIKDPNGNIRIVSGDQVSKQPTGKVKMKAPNGSIGFVRPDKVEEAKKKGAIIIK
jgi:hypothetical protein|tara:strand:- start:10155 stop:12920 length:2766 start_codon:yes stop_codon:yes gene_type:complete